MILFFFKQKTAYEMRISDWSSDVCSSDLKRRTKAPRLAVIAEQIVEIGRGVDEAARQADAREEGGAGRADIGVGGAQALRGAEHIRPAYQHIGRHRRADPPIDMREKRHRRRKRSDEHKTELQPQMRK